MQSALPPPAVIAPGVLEPLDAVPVVTPHADPFGLVRRDLDAASREAFAVVAIVDLADDVLPANHPCRCVCRIDGRLALCEVAGREAVQIGQPVSFVEAGELATQILGGESRAATAPHALRTLALAYIAALAEAERGRR